MKIIMRAFLTDICGIPDKEDCADWTEADTTENGWYWGRVEHNELRGVQHLHFLVNLPRVLDTGLLGRIIHNGRVVASGDEVRKHENDLNGFISQSFKHRCLLTRFLRHPSIRKMWALMGTTTPK